MPTIIRKSSSTLFQTRREILHAVSWQVRSHVWSPPTDQYETEAAFVIRVEVAGMREDDFEVAIEEGAHWVRVGTAIFGARPKKEMTNEDS